MLGNETWNLKVSAKVIVYIETYGVRDRHCTYNVALRRVRATTVAVEKQ